MRNDDPRDPIDTLIDDTARSLTAAHPPVSLRAAVLQRIDRQASGWRIPAWAGGAAVAALAVVAALWVDDPGGRAPGGGQTGDAAVASVAAPLEVDATPRTTAHEPAMTPRRPPRERVARFSTSSRVIGPAVGPATHLQLVRLVEEPAITVERVEIDPLTMEPLPTGRLSTEPLAMDLMEAPMPLRAERLEIEPITIH